MEARGSPRSRWLVACALVLATVAGAITSVLMSSHAAAISPSRSVNVECRSPSLGGELPAVVYLPAGYAHRSTRYPTIYFLHGLPASPDDYRTNSFVADGVRAAGREAIVVAPQGARAQDSDREYLDWGPRENWPAAIAHDLVACVDSRFRTIASRVGRALIGLSAGGYGAFNVGLRNLGTFAALESWSGYFAATDPSGLVKLDLGSVSATRSARVPRGRRLRHRLSRRPTFVGFYVGSQDPTFANANVLLDRAFTVHHIPHLFHLYPGGHSTELWERWAPLWLRYALDHLARPRS